MGCEVLEVDADPLRDINKGFSRTGTCCRWHSAFLRRDESARSGKEKQQECQENPPLTACWFELHGSTVPFPSTTVTIRSIAGILISSFNPSCPQISTLSTLLAVPIPNCKRCAALEA